MSWRMDSGAGAAIWDTEPLSPGAMAERDDEIRWLMKHEIGNWGLINGRIRRSRDPVANLGFYTSLQAVPPIGPLANVTSLNGEASLFNTAGYAPWPAFSLTAPTAWEIHIAFTATTSTSPGNVTVVPRVGSVAAGSSSTGGITLGTDAAITLTASITTLWQISGNIDVQSIGLPGANSKAYGTFNTTAKPATAGVGAATINNIYGYTQASFDSTVASGLVIGMANTVATITYAVQQVHFISL